MSGSTYKFGDQLLVPGAPCIIVVDTANSPAGTWWGVVREVESALERTYIKVRAEIVGRFDLAHNLGGSLDERPADPGQGKGREPTVNYRVYPDTDLTRSLFRWIENAELKTKRAEQSAAAWKATHTETMEHLVSRRLVVQ